MRIIRFEYNPAASADRCSGGRLLGLRQAIPLAIEDSKVSSLEVLTTGEDR